MNEIIKLRKSLQDCADKMSLPTGVRFIFEIRENSNMHEMQIVARDTGEAWRLVGCAIDNYMHGPYARRVTALQLLSA